MNLLSYLGMSLQSEVCLWTLIGLIRNIFDATLFKVNENLKQVWQMSMPDELSTSMQGVLRTMISGVMLLQCFTVYVYVATYIVLLYPVFLEERPALVLPWLLVAAIRKLLCELTSLALGLGTCVLLGASRPPCVKFVIVKIVSIMPSFYMWMMMLSYYNALKVVAVFKTFPAIVPTSHCDYGLELAIRRRRTKSLLGEDQVRRKLLASFYGQHSVSNEDIGKISKNEHISRMVHATDTKTDCDEKFMYVIHHSVDSSKRPSDAVSYEDWCINDIVIPRDTDRILEQFVLMSLRVSAFIKTDGTESMNSQNVTLRTSNFSYRQDALHCAAITADATDNPLYIGRIKGSTASYLKEYPQIFMKRSSYDQTAQNIQKPNSQSENVSLETFDGNKIIDQSTSRKKMSFEHYDITPIVDSRALVTSSDVSEYNEKLNPMCSYELTHVENKDAYSNLSRSSQSLKVLAENKDSISETKETELETIQNDHIKQESPGSDVSSNNPKQ